MDRAEHDRIIASAHQAVVDSQVLLSAPSPRRPPGAAVAVSSGCGVCGARAELTAASAVRAWLDVHPYRCTAR